MGLLIFGLFSFVLLVVAHEYGHFLVAKKKGVEVEEFGVGFPPKIFGRKMGKGIFEGYYTVNLLPLGGFVRLKGEHDADKEKGAFGSVSTSAKLQIMLAGVLVNYLLAVVLFTIVAWVGMPQLVPNQFSVKSNETISRSDVVSNFVDEGSPAASAGIVSGDIIKSINNQSISTSQELIDAAKSNAGQEVTISFIHKGDTRQSETTLLSSQEVEASKQTDNPKGYLGVVPTEYKLATYTWAAPVVAVGSTVQFSWLTLKAIGSSLAALGKAFVNAVTGDGTAAKQEASKASENVSGPVGIFAILQQGTALGYQFILFVIALISLTLAIMNFLPIPALDGGRAFVMLLFRAMKKPLTAKREELIHGTGFALLILLFVVITIVDVRRFY
ncbi:site-2 protease family protein [Candidatus Nomurabacteria bacterium]|nr:site-2 protease family protein [Candidatus Saccharibacteria bacterium]MCA9350279.1 site-2 protease family protein [Candidatus Saccharibacteria bacterium]MCB9839547.1 site-2 protease family protein [Candidatus Nomurabacteria bacterium]